MKLKKPKFWDLKNPNILAFLLWPLSIFFKAITKLKKRKKIKSKKIKTICLGNIYIGGTGKTSLAIKFKEILDKNNIKTCFIKKFYPDQIDEQRLLEKYGKLFTDKIRINALNQAISENYEVAIFDDGLQDDHVDYDLNFVCFNNHNWIGNGFIIPAGPLREDIKNLKYYDNVFLNGNNENLENIKKQIKNLNPKINIYESKYSILNSENFNKNENYLAFSGIGNHQTFINMLINEKFNILENLEFPDHYIYNDNDLDKIFIKSNKLNAKIITTEKDYLRIDKSKSENIGFIKSEVKIIEESKIINILINKNEKN